MLNNTEKEIEKKLEVRFKNPRLLHTALVHRSQLNESKETSSNERLEFLGDAVLEFIVSAALIRNHPAFDEGELTALRSNLVNTNSLAQAAEKLELGKSLYLSKGEEESGGRKNKALLANTFESIIGAIFLDQGIPSCEKVVEALLLPKTKQALLHLKDPKSMLQEQIQKGGQRTPIYRIISEEGPDHAKIFTVGVFVNGNLLAKGTGMNKQEAEQEAAQQALKNL